MHDSRSLNFKVTASKVELSPKMSQEKFDLTKVHECFDRCLADPIDPDDVLVDAYLEAFKELYK